MIGRDGVVPLGVECVALDVEFGHLLIGGFHAFRIKVAIDLAAKLEPGFGCGAADQLNNHLVADQRLSALILRDVGEQPGVGRKDGNAVSESQLAVPGSLGREIQFSVTLAIPNLS